MRNQAANKDSLIKRLKEDILKSEERWQKNAKKPYTMSNKTIIDYLRQLIDRDMVDYEEQMINPPPELEMIKKKKAKTIGNQTWISDVKYMIDYVYTKTKQPPRDIGIQ